VTKTTPGEKYIDTNVLDGGRGTWKNGKKEKIFWEEGFFLKTNRKAEWRKKPVFGRRANDVNSTED